MAKLIYSAIASLDGYVEDARGEFDWAAPDEEVHEFVNELVRPLGMYLYGRRMYETMLFWETVSLDDDAPRYHRDFTEIWRAAEKVVYSRTLEAVSSGRTRLERTFDTQEIQHLKTTGNSDLAVGGAELASQALESGIVDELHLFVFPVIVGGGKAWLPKQLHLTLELLDSRRFASGVVFLRYRPAFEGTR